MGEAKRVNPRIVDQDIDVALAKLDRAPRDLARARGITKIGRNKIRMPARRAYFGNRLFAAFRIPAYDQYMDAQLGQFVGYGATYAACTSGNERARHVRTPSHLTSMPKKPTV